MHTYTIILSGIPWVYFEYWLTMFLLVHICIVIFIELLLLLLLRLLFIIKIVCMCTVQFRPFKLQYPGVLLLAWRGLWGQVRFSARVMLALHGRAVCPAPRFAFLVCVYDFEHMQRLALELAGCFSLKIFLHHLSLPSPPFTAFSLVIIVTYIRLVFFFSIFYSN